MFSRMTDETRSVCDAAGREAHAMHADRIGTGHLLLALLDADGDPSAGAVREGLRRKSVFDAEAPKVNAVPYSDDAMAAIRAAAKLADTEEMTAGHLRRALLADDSFTSRQLAREHTELLDDRPRRSRAGRDAEEDVKYLIDLRAQARAGQLNPVFGRDAEIRELTKTLTRRFKNAPVLVGPAGVGKTAIVEGLAQRLEGPDAPGQLADCQILALDLGAMLAGTRYRGEFEKRLQQVKDFIAADPRRVLFIDELHSILGAGSAEGSMDAATMLKPALARGEIRAIGATTTDEYDRFIARDAALDRRFHPVTVAEPTAEQAVQILDAVRDTLCAHHNVRITDAALQAAVSMTVRYVPGRHLPDKALDALDDACSDAALDGTLDLTEAEPRLRERSGRPVTITDRHIARVIHAWTGVPVGQLCEQDLDLGAQLRQQVIGQDGAVDAVARAVLRSRAGLADPGRPAGSFLFHGPTGVGKTELARALARTVMGDENALQRFDMSEYAEKHSAARLIGSPPGYKGNAEGGTLVRAALDRPYSVILLDEIEKAHEDVLNVLLQVLDDGRLTDGRGVTANFRNCIIVMTSNAAAEQVTSAPRTMGFAPAQASGLQDRIMDQLRRHFRPELLNRIDDVVAFGALDDVQLTAILKLQVDDLCARAQAAQQVSLTFTSQALAHILSCSREPGVGANARPLRRTLQRLVTDPLALLVAAGGYSPSIRVGVRRGQIVLSPSA